MFPPCRNQSVDLQSQSIDWFIYDGNICDVFCDLVPFVKFKKHENTHGGELLLIKFQALAYIFPKSNTPLWVFFTLFKFYKWYKIVQSVTFGHERVRCSLWSYSGLSLLTLNNYQSVRK